MKKQIELAAPVKRGRGRPKGSVGFVGVRLEDLMRVLQPASIVLVDKSMLTILKAQGVILQDTNRPEAQDEPLQLTVMNFENAA